MLRKLTPFFVKKCVCIDFSYNFPHSLPLLQIRVRCCRTSRTLSAFKLVGTYWWIIFNVKSIIRFFFINNFASYISLDSSHMYHYHLGNVGHLKKRQSEKFFKTCFYFLRRGNCSNCIAKLILKRYSLKDAEGLLVGSGIPELKNRVTHYDVS